MCVPFISQMKRKKIKIVKQRLKQQFNTCCLYPKKKRRRKHFNIRAHTHTHAQENAQIVYCNWTSKMGKTSVFFVVSFIFFVPFARVFFLIFEQTKMKPFSHALYAIKLSINFPDGWRWWWWRQQQQQWAAQWLHTFSIYNFLCVDCALHLF